jgi:hypothetical protein
VLLGGCSAEGALRSRAAAYYNFMVGVSPRQRYSSFLSPACRATYTKKALRQLDDKLSGENTPDARYKPVRPAQIRVARDGRYAITTASAEAGQAFANVGAIRWVRVAGKWYKYGSSKAETDAYGSFPVSLAPPSGGPPSSAAPAGMSGARRRPAGTAK